MATADPKVKLEALELVLKATNRNPQPNAPENITKTLDDVTPESLQNFVSELREWQQELPGEKVELETLQNHIKSDTTLTASEQTAFANFFKAVKPIPVSADTAPTAKAPTDSADDDTAPTAKAPVPPKISAQPSSFEAKQPDNGDHRIKLEYKDGKVTTTVFNSKTPDKIIQKTEVDDPNGHIIPKITAQWPSVSEPNQKKLFADVLSEKGSEKLTSYMQNIKKLSDESPEPPAVATKTPEQEKQELIDKSASLLGLAGDKKTEFFKDLFPADTKPETIEKMRVHQRELEIYAQDGKIPPENIKKAVGAAKFAMESPDKIKERNLAAAGFLITGALNAKLDDKKPNPEMFKQLQIYLGSPPNPERIKAFETFGKQYAEVSKKFQEEIDRQKERGINPAGSDAQGVAIKVDQIVQASNAGGTNADTVKMLDTLKNSPAAMADPNLGKILWTAAAVTKQLVDKPLETTDPAYHTKIGNMVTSAQTPAEKAYEAARTAWQKAHPSAGSSDAPEHTDPGSGGDESKGHDHPATATTAPKPTAQAASTNPAKPGAPIDLRPKGTPTTAGQPQVQVVYKPWDGTARGFISPQGHHYEFKSSLAGTTFYDDKKYQLTEAKLVAKTHDKHAETGTADQIMRAQEEYWKKNGAGAPMPVSTQSQPPVTVQREPLPPLSPSAAVQPNGQQPVPGNTLQAQQEAAMRAQQVAMSSYQGNGNYYRGPMATQASGQFSSVPWTGPPTGGFVSSSGHYYNGPRGGGGSSSVRMGANINTAQVLGLHYTPLFR